MFTLLRQASLLLWVATLWLSSPSCCQLSLRLGQALPHHQPTGLSLLLNACRLPALSFWIASGKKQRCNSVHIVWLVGVRLIFQEIIAQCTQGMWYCNTLLCRISSFLSLVSLRCHFQTLPPPTHIWEKEEGRERYWQRLTAVHNVWNREL